MLEKLAASPAPVVALDGDCNVLAWRRITDPRTQSFRRSCSTTGASRPR